MAISDSQKVDYLYKKLGFGVGKTDTSAVKSPSNESIASPLLIRGDTVWVYSNQIPTSAPAANSSIVTVYLGTRAIQSVNDGTSSTNRTWLTNLGDWIGSEFGATYQPRVWAAPSGTANAAATGTRLFPDGSGNNDAWFFDPQSGILNFSDTNVPTAVTGNVIFIEGYRYVGTKGLTTALGNITFTGSNISTNALNANLTFAANGTGYIVASGNLIATGNVTASYYIGNGSTLTNITGANVTGTVANAAYALQAGQSNNANTAIYVTGLTGTNVNVALGYVPLNSNATALTAQYVTQSNQANITSVGTLTGLTLSGTLNGTAIQAATIGNATTTFTGVTYTASGSFNGPHNGTLGVAGGNTAIVSTLSATGAAAVDSLQVNNAATIGSGLTVGGQATVNSFYANTNSIVGGNLSILGNLIVSGNVITSGSNNVSFTDSIIELHTLPNLANLTYDDGKDIGIRFHYYKTQNNDAFLGWANDTGFLEWYGAGATETGNVINGTYGTIKSGALILANTTPSTGLNTGVLQTNGGASFSGNIYANGIAYLGSSTAIALSNPLLVATTSANSYTQIQIQNQSNSSAASSDFIATADDGTDSTRYIDMGINGSGWNQSNWTVSGARDGYLYTSGVNLTIGTDTLGKTLKIHAGGVLAANVVATFNDAATASTSSATGALVVNGGLGVSGAVNSGSTLGVVSNATVNALTVNSSATFGTTLSALGGLQSTPIGNVSASTGQFTTVSATGNVTGAAITSNASITAVTTMSALGGLQATPIGNITPSTALFTTVGTSGNLTANALTVNGSATVGSTLGVTGNINGLSLTLSGSEVINGSSQIKGGLQSTPIGNASASTGQFTTVSATGNVTAAAITSNASITAVTTINALGGLQATPIGNVAPSTALFTTVGTSSNATVNGLTVNTSTTVGSTLGVVGNLTLTANLIQTGANNFTAHTTTANALSAGTVQANAYSIISTNTQFTSVGAGSAAILPTAPAAGTVIFVANDGANALLLYPPVGGYIDQATTNTPITIVAGGMWYGVSLSPTVWTSVSPDTQGTANQITATQGNGAVILSLPSAVTAPGTLTATAGLQNTAIGNVTPSTALFTTVGASSNATVAALTVNGSATIGSTLGVTGNVVANYFIGNFAGNISGNISAAGSNTQILFNDGGTVNGNAGLTFNKSTNTLVVGTINAATIGNASAVHIGNGAALASLTGANVTGTVANATYALQADQSNNANTATTSTYVTGLTGTNVNVALGYVPLNSNATALTAQYVTQAAQANITSVGILTSLNTSGNISANGTTISNSLTVGTTLGVGGALNVGGAGAFTGGVKTNSITSASSAVNLYNDGSQTAINIGSVGTITTISGNLTVVGGIQNTPIGNAVPNTARFTTVGATGNVTANALTVNTSATIGTTLGVTGNVTASYFVGNGSALTSIIGANVTGTVANASYALQSGQANSSNISQYVTQAAQANITSVGTLTGLTLSGTLSGTTLQAATIGNTGAAYVGSTLTISGNAVVGNLDVLGNVTYINSTVTDILDPIIELNTAANGAPLSGNAPYDSGIKTHYWDGSADRQSFFGRTNDTGNFEFYSNVISETGNVIVGTYGTIKTGNIVLTGTGSVSNNLTVGATALVNALAVNTSATATGNITAAALTSNTSITAGTTLSALGGIQATPIGNATASTGAFTTITSTGNVSTGNLAVYGSAGMYFANISGAALGPYGGIQTWQFFSQNAVLGGPGSWILFPDGSPQYTAYPGANTAGVTSLTLSGNIAAAALTSNTSITAGTTLSALGGIQATPIGNATASTGAFTSLTAATLNASTIGNTGANIIGTLSTNAQPNITSVGALSGLTIAPAYTLFVNGTTNNSGLVYSNGAVQVAGGVGINKDLFVGGNLKIVSNLISNGTVTVNALSSNGNITAAGLTSTGSITAVTTLNALGGLQATPIGNTAPSTAIFTSESVSGNSTVNALTVNNSATVGTTLSVTGNAVVGNITTGGLIKATSTIAATSNVTGAVQVSGGVGVAGNVYVGQRVGWVAANSVSAVYQVYNAATNSLDTIFG